VHVSGARNRQVIMAADTILATLRDNAIQGQL
jgi:hypothetical protein